MRIRSPLANGVPEIRDKQPPHDRELRATMWIVRDLQQLDEHDGNEYAAVVQETLLLRSSLSEF